MESREASHAAAAPLASDDAAPHCPACDYDLRALVGDRCPECGLKIDRAALATLQIPWVARKSIGRVRAYFKTASMVFAHPRKFASNIIHPISLQEAKRFQNVTVWLAFLPLLAVGLWVYMADLDRRLTPGMHATLFQMVRRSVSDDSVRRGWILEWLGVVFCAACLWFFLKGATGVASYLCHPRRISIERQNRAIALSYYACAPLAWVPVALGSFACATLLGQDGAPKSLLPWVALCVVVGMLSSFAAILGWWWATFVLTNRTTNRSGIGAALFGAVVPILWAVIAAIVLGGLPLAYAFVAMVILSLR